MYKKVTFSFKWLKAPRTVTDQLNELKFLVKLVQYLWQGQANTNALLKQGWKRPHLTESGHINWREYYLGVSGQWLSLGNLLIKWELFNKNEKIEKIENKRHCSWISFDLDVLLICFIKYCKKKYQLTDFDKGKTKGATHLALY